MKVVQSIQKLYNTKYEYYNVLKPRIDKLIEGNKPEPWHYISRIKTPESFALKIETGRFTKEDIFDDFFACTLVVENIGEINTAIEFAKQHFDFLIQKPSSLKFTLKESHSFQFDDIRLYCTYKNTGTEALSKTILDLRFEIQIKTFLQHAWAIATHDLIYKSDQIHWGKERIAYQVKATLEHAEVSISGVESLCQLDELPKDNKQSKKVNSVIIIVNKNWSQDDLPHDRRRLAQNIISLFENLNIPLTELTTILNKETDAGRGVLLKNLSPYLIIAQSVINQYPEKMISFLRSKHDTKTRLLLTQELTLPIIKNIQKKRIIDLRFD
jgi:ppGpp synthetase/RelA/SpoT-type nucleotidyltranferase